MLVIILPLFFLGVYPSATLFSGVLSLHNFQVVNTNRNHLIKLTAELLFSSDCFQLWRFKKKTLCPREGRHSKRRGWVLWNVGYKNKNLRWTWTCEWLIVSSRYLFTGIQAKLTPGNLLNAPEGVTLLGLITTCFQKGFLVPSLACTKWNRWHGKRTWALREAGKWADPPKHRFKYSRAMEVFHQMSSVEATDIKQRGATLK